MAGKQDAVFQGVDGELKRISNYLPAILKPKETLLTHTGLCGTDLHTPTFNCVLGHEGVGIVQAIGWFLLMITNMPDKIENNERISRDSTLEPFV